MRAQTLVILSAATCALLAASTASAQHGGRATTTGAHYSRVSRVVRPGPGSNALRRAAATQAHLSRYRVAPLRRASTLTPRRAPALSRASSSLLSAWSVSMVKALAFWPTLWWGTHQALVHRPPRLGPVTITRHPPPSGGAAAHGGR